MSKQKFTGGGEYGKGYYIALILCAAAIGISGYLYYRNANEKEIKLQEPEVTVQIPVRQEKTLPVVATEPPETEPPQTTVETRPPARKVFRTGSPLEGKQVADYAMDCLSYNVTTRDWRIHNGVDIGAEAGTKVLAAADGRIYTTYEDDAMGTTVVIRHEGGYTTEYASLDPELAVATGDEVKLGEVIGCVGTTALVESALGPHVHFSVTYRDSVMDPAEFLTLGAD